jgi:adenine phosphoribosyltransferase
MMHYFDQFEEKIVGFNDYFAEQKKEMDLAVQAFLDAPVYTVSGNGGSVESYNYFLYPFKGLSLVSSRINEFLGRYLSRLVAPGTEVIVTIDSDGIGVGSFVASELDLPLVIAKSFHYHQDCVSFSQKAGYHERIMYLPKCLAGKKVAIVDCMVSTGGTIQGMLGAMKEIGGVEVTGILCVNNKSNYGQQTTELFGYPYSYLIETHITEDKRVFAKTSPALRLAFWQEVDKKFYSLTEDCSTFSKISKQGYRVGSIIVDADTFEILSWGFRRGHLHGEQDALSMLKINIPDWENRRLTLYSTMEPCVYRNNVGHTPCAELIADTPQIKWVIIGSRDVADDRICGEGIKKLVTSGKSIRLIEGNQVFRAEEHMNANNVSAVTGS